jgi:hypothetical protein
MNCVFFCLFLCLFFVLGSGGKAQKKSIKKHKKRKKKQHNKISIYLEKMKLRPPDLDSLRTSGPANVSHHFLSPTSFPKESLRS